MEKAPNPLDSNEPPIGDRELTDWEKMDVMLAGISEEDARQLSSENLSALADFSADVNGLLLGC